MKDEQLNEVEATLFDIINHIEEYGNYITNDDKPTALIIGYRCAKTNKCWKFGVASIKDLTSSDCFLHKTIRNNIVTAEGRLELIKILQKACRLKAFW